MENLKVYPVDKNMLGDAMRGSKSFGPLTISYDINLAIPQISASATLFGVSIGHMVLNPQNPSATIGGSVGIAKAEVTLTANFAAKQLDYKVEVETFGHGIHKSGVLFSW